MPLTFFSLALVNLRSMKKHKARVTLTQKTKYENDNNNYWKTD